MKALERLADVALTTALIAAFFSDMTMVATLIGASWGIRFGNYLDLSL